MLHCRLISPFIHTDLSTTADEGGATRMSGGIPWLTLPAGYLGSSFIGAVLIACGFNTNASKIACLVLAGFFVLTLWWARRNVLYVPALPSTRCFAADEGKRTWVLILMMSGLIVLFWFVGGGVALRFFVRHPLCYSSSHDNLH
jgi:hypothetical protein